MVTHESKRLYAIYYIQQTITYLYILLGKISYRYGVNFAKYLYETILKSKNTFCNNIQYHMEFKFHFEPLHLVEL